MPDARCGASARESLRQREREVDQQLDVQRHDDGGDDARDELSHTGATSGPILAFDAVNSHQGHHGEGQLQAQDHLTQDQELRRADSPYAMVTPAAGTIAMPRVTRRRSQGGSLKLMKPSMTICPAIVAVTVELRPQHRSAMPNKVGAIAAPSKRLQERMRLADLGDFGPPRMVEGGGGENQQGCVDGEREHQRDGRIERRERSASRRSGRVSP